MSWRRDVAMTAACAAGLLGSGTASAQDMPAEYKVVLSTLGKTGDFKDGVLKVNIPRTDVRVTIGQRSAPTPFGFRGWLALTKSDAKHFVMGDLVLTEDEVNPVMSAILQNGDASAAFPEKGCRRQAGDAGTDDGDIDVHPIDGAFGWGRGVRLPEGR